MKNNHIAFTLVELIVVITILAVLATVGFISMQGYASSSRDSVRLTDMTNISKGFNLKLTKGEKIPLPENNIQITASGTLLSYQGDAGKAVLGNIGIHGDGVDPIDETYYTYSTNANRNKYQILGFLEKNEKDTKIKGDELGIILSPISNIPIHKEENNVDVLNSSSELKYILNNDFDGSFIADNNDIKDKWARGLGTYSCEELLKKLPFDNIESKNYFITSRKGDKIEVFCDMNNGGFTALFSVDPTGKTWKYDSTQWTNPITNINDFLTQETTFDSYRDFATQSIKICRGDLDNCYIMNHNKNIPLQKFYTDDISYIDFSFWQKIEGYSDDSNVNQNYPDNIGVDKRQDFIDSLNVGSGDFFSPLLSKIGLGINISSNNKIGMQGDSNNAWPGFDNHGIGIGVFRIHNCGTKDIAPSYDYSRAYSIALADRCVYENPDNQMWYVLAQ